MPKSISEDQQALIRKRYLQGMPFKEIAIEVGLHPNTVAKYIKSAPAPVGLGSEDTDAQIDYSTILSKREEKIVKKIRKEMWLYEDPIEGWTYHLTKHDDRIKQQGLWWTAIVYTDSAPSDWVEKLRATGMQVAISPPHDKDSWDHDSPAVVNPETGEVISKGARYKIGDRKKEHYHLIVKCDKKTSWREMNALLQSITNCPYIQKCRSLKGAYEYFLHINHPNKYQGYDKKDIVKLNGFVIEATRFEQGILFDEILTLIREKQITKWTDVCARYHGQPEYILLLSSRPAVITELLKENWRSKNPKGRVQRIAIEAYNMKNEKKLKKILEKNGLEKNGKEGNEKNGE